MALPFNGWSSSIFTKVHSDLGLNLIADRSTITYLIDNHYCKKSDGSYTHIPPDYTSMGLHVLIILMDVLIKEM